jgi:hypothetical protein
LGCMSFFSILLLQHSCRVSHLNLNLKFGPHFWSFKFCIHKANGTWPLQLSFSKILFFLEFSLFWNYPASMFLKIPHFKLFSISYLKPHCVRCGHFKVDDVSALEPSSKPPVRIVEDNVTASLHQQRTPWPGCCDVDLLVPAAQALSWIEYSVALTSV